MRRAPVVAAVTAAVLSAGGLTAAASGPRLSAHGPVHLDGTSASAAFEIGDRTIRQVRYADRGELGYTFVLRNHGALPVTVEHVAPAVAEATLLRVDRLERSGTASTHFDVPAGGQVAVRLVLDMAGCERVSSRAGSFLAAVRLRTEVGGLLDRQATVPLPEELHTGSPREARCPLATSESRSPG